jgi:hypothetical protein
MNLIKILCNHSLDQYGLGIDLVAEITHHPEIVDLLISLTFFAADMACKTNGVRDLNPSPKNISSEKSNFNGTELEIGNSVVRFCL